MDGGSVQGYVCFKDAVDSQSSTDGVVAGVSVLLTFSFIGGGIRWLWKNRNEQCKSVLRSMNIGWINNWVLGEQPNEAGE